MQPPAKRPVSRRNFLIVVCTTLAFMAVLLVGKLAYSLAFSDARASAPRRCFAVDMLEHRVPDWRASELRAHHERPPVAFGKLCLDRQQLVVDWRFDQSFTRLYAVKDLLLRGPLANNSDGDSAERVAPAVLTLSTQTNRRNQFYGSTIIERHALQAILQQPARYYVSLEAFDNGPATTIREVARHNLNYAI